MCAEHGKTMTVTRALTRAKGREDRLTHKASKEAGDERFTSLTTANQNSTGRGMLVRGKPSRGAAALVTTALAAQSWREAELAPTND